MITPLENCQKNVYITGIAYETAGISHAGYWLNGKWNLLDAPCGTLRSEANHIFISGTDVYITGWCKMETTLHEGYWKNGVWRTLDRVYKSGNRKTADEIAISENGDVYISGIRYDQKDDSKMYAGYWLNNCWYDLPVPAIAHCSWTNGISIEDGNVYIGGCYQDDKGNHMNSCYWINGVRHDLPVIENNYSSQCMVVSGGNVYTLCSDGYWKNDTWHKLPRAGELDGIAVFGNDVYVFGFFSEPRGYWLNGNWNTPSKPDDSTGIGLKNIAIFENDVYITGFYEDNYGGDYPCYWLNGVLHLLAVPYDYRVTHVTQNKNFLYFSTASGIQPSLFPMRPCIS